MATTINQSSNTKAAYKSTSLGEVAEGVAVKWNDGANTRKNEIEFPANNAGITGVSTETLASTASGAFIIQTGGIARMLASGAVTKGGYVAVGTDGKAKPATGSGTVIIGTARFALSADEAGDDQFVEVDLDDKGPGVVA